MGFIYKLGIIIGAVTLYVIATLGISTFMNAHRNDETIFMFAIVLGAVYFMVLLVFTLERFGLW